MVSSRLRSSPSLLSTILAPVWTLFRQSAGEATEDGTSPGASESSDQVNPELGDQETRQDKEVESDDSDNTSPSSERKSDDEEVEIEYDS